MIDVNVIERIFKNRTGSVIFINNKLGKGTLTELSKLNDVIIFRNYQCNDEEFKSLIKRHYNHDVIIFDEFEKSSLNHRNDVMFEIIEGNLVGKNVIIIANLEDEYCDGFMDSSFMNKLIIFNIE